LRTSSLRLVEVTSKTMRVGAMNGVVNRVAQKDRSGVLYGWKLLSAFCGESDSESESDEHSDDSTDGDAADPLAGALTAVRKDEDDSEDAHSLLGKAQESTKFVAFFDTNVESNRAYIRPPGEHEYAITDVFMKNGRRMVRLRNPWGAEDSNKWLHGYGGVFELTFKEWLQFYGEDVSVNKYKPGWHRYLERCEFKSALTANATHRLKITVTETTNVMFGMFADGYRKRHVRSKPWRAPRVWCSVVGEGLNEGSQKGHAACFYEDELNDSELRLEPGVYYFQPKARNPSGEINFGLFSSLPVTVETVKIELI